MGKEQNVAAITVVKDDKGGYRDTPRSMTLPCGYTEVRRERLSTKIQSIPGNCVQDSIMPGDTIDPNLPDGIDTVVMYHPSEGYIWVTVASVAAYITACAACCTN
jgi:hypothetical protein